MSGVRRRRWILIVLLLLFAWGLRVCFLEEVPPGWRDDELINIHALSGRLLRGEFPIYYLGASGHEPLYHHLHAGVHAVLGFNVLSGHILSVAFGMLSVALTYSLVRRLFPGTRATAAVAALTLAVSFWSLMYSRTAIRHISLPPFVLVTVYVLWRRLDAERASCWHWVSIGLLLGLSLYTYTASRLLPVILIVFVGYLALFHPERLEGRWRGIAVALIVMALLATPLSVAIVQGRSRRAIEGIGADARVTELASPLRALQDGDPQPLLISVVKTLGMFHASGDPEWLYNIPGRPVFGLFSGLLLWLGVALCLYRWRDPAYFFLLPWLGLGLSPAFISTPPASLSHTIIAQPVVYILPALALVEICRWLEARQSATLRRALVSGSAPAEMELSRVLTAAGSLVLIVFVVSNAIRDLRDYFVVWPERGMVRLLYRADQREVADYLDSHPEITDVAVGSGLMGPWDRTALEVDIERENILPRLFNPERALLWAAGDSPPIVILPSWPDSTGPIEDLLGPGREVSSHLTVHMPPVVSDAGPLSERAPADTASLKRLASKTRFANGLTLAQVRWLGEDRPTPGEEGNLLTLWQVSEPLDLPPMPIVAQPPPPETYSGPRLAIFAHLLDADGRVLSIDDGLWVDPLTLQPGDRFVQIHRLAVPSDSSVWPHALELGLYDPKTNQRWDAVGAEGASGTDLVYIPLGEQRESR